VYSVVYYDSDHNFYYVKRFVAENLSKEQYYLPEDSKCQFVLITDKDYPRLKINFGGKHKGRVPEEIDVEEFIAVKGFKAKGKRLSNYEIAKVEELEPTRFKEENNGETENGDGSGANNENGSGEQTLFNLE